MPLIDSVLSDGLKDRQFDNLIRAVTKPSVLRIPTTACPIYENPLHWLDGGNIMDYSVVLDNFVSAKGFANLTTLNDGSTGIGFYATENVRLGIVSAIPFINNNKLNFCVNPEKSIEYGNRIVFTEYTVEPGQIGLTIDLGYKLRDKINELINSPNWGVLTPPQRDTILFLRDRVLDDTPGAPPFSMTEVPAPVLSQPGFSGITPDQYFVTSTPTASANIYPFPYVGLEVSACPPLFVLMGDTSIVVPGSSNSTYFSGHPETSATANYYGGRVEEDTGGSMPSGVGGLGKHTTDLISSLLGILSALNARNGLLSYLAALGGICAAFAQAIGTVLGVINAIMATIQFVLNTILGLIDAVINAIASVITAIVNQITALIGQVMKLMQQVMSKIMDEIKKIVEFFMDLINQALAAIFGEGDGCIAALIQQVAVPAAIGAVAANSRIANSGIF